MADEKKVTLKEFARQRGLGFNALVRVAVDGNIDPRKPQDRASLERLLHTLDPLAQLASTEETSGNLNSETQIVKIRIPGDNLYYVTIMKGGKVILTRGADGNLDLSNPKEGLDEIIDVLAYSTMFDTAKRIEIEKKKRTGKKGKKPTFKPTRDKPGYVRDPALDNYFIENADALAYSALTHPEKIKKGQIISGIDALEEIIEDPEFLRTARELGLTIEAEPVTSYIAKHKREISTKTRRIIIQIIEKEDIRSAAGEVLLDYIDKNDRQKTRLRALCEKADSALPLYNRFYEEKTRRGLEDKGEHFVICLRQLVLEVLHSARSAGATIPAEDYENYVSTTARWVAYSKAADYVKSDREIQSKIIKKLRDNRDERNIRDKIFEAVSDLGKLVLDPDHSYDKIFYRFLVAGLWMEGVMERETEEGTIPRTAAGAINEYTDGLGNLIERYSTYDRLLKKSFEKQLEEGTVAEYVKLDTQAQCSGLGRLLYNSLTEKERNKFSTIKGDRPLESEGTYITRLLRAYVGINREFFTETMSKE